MTTMTDYEQLMLELINRARLDPASEAARYGISLNQGLSAGRISATPKQPLAPDDAIHTAARNHSQWMINSDVFSHTGSGGSNAGARMQAAGYAFTGSWTWGENIAWRGTTGTPNVEQYILEEHRSLFLSAGHRVNTLNDNYREVGVGAVTGVFTSNGRNYNTVMSTVDFAKTGSAYFITGVVYDDRNNNDFYSVGEGTGAVKIQAALSGGTASSDTSASSGGYGVAVTSATGLYDVTFSGGGLPATIGVKVQLAAQNAKVDLVDDTTIETSATATLGNNAANLKLLGIANIDGTGNSAANSITGNAGSNVLNGVAGNDILAGGAGADTFVFNSALAANNDRITDFNVADDTIRLNSAIFSQVGAFGTLTSGAFYTGSAAHDASDRIIYNSSTGALLYDDDGTGGHAAVQFATLSTGLALTNSDFLIT